MMKMFDWKITPLAMVVGFACGRYLPLVVLLPLVGLALLAVGYLLISLRRLS